MVYEAKEYPLDWWNTPDPELNSNEEDKPAAYRQKIMKWLKSRKANSSKAQVAAVPKKWNIARLLKLKNQDFKKSIFKYVWSIKCSDS